MIACANNFLVIPFDLNETKNCSFFIYFIAMFMYQWCRTIPSKQQKQQFKMKFWFGKFSAQNILYVFSYNRRFVQCLKIKILDQS